MKSLFKYLTIAAAMVSSGLFACDCSKITVVQTDQAPQAIGPYSQAVQAGSYLFISGQLAINPATKILEGDTVEEQTSQVLDNIEAILAAKGLTLENVVRAEVYLQDLNDFKAMNAVYAERFSQPIKPARQTMQVARLPLDGLVEISCVAFIPMTEE